MLGVGEQIVGRIEVHPAVAETGADRNPGVGGVRSTRRGRPGGGMREQIAARITRESPRERKQAIIRWAKSWQTPRFFSRTSRTGVDTVVASGSN